MHTLYRMYDADGDLLYVGVSLNVAQRFAEHKAAKPWWHDIHSVTLAQYPDRAAVLAAELDVIREESPRYNIQGRPAATASRGQHGPASAVLEVASQRRQQLAAEREAARAAEREAIIEAMADGMRQVQVVAITGFTREYIRRITSS